ncbi:MAG: glycosyltransferase family 39 protein [Zoogloeaceae bacterium]|nr:glycosyltransferase family 39 protein [Zoogloeaceae bacterium]
MLLGLFPVSDEGYYAYVAQQIHHSLANGEGIPNHGGLSFYPMLCSWVFSLQYNPMISLRLIDFGAAVGMAFLLYKVLARICNNNTGAALITFIFTFTMNQVGFIDNGFKNSITAAFVPLLLALYIGIAAIQDKKSGNAWLMAGALTALAVVFRETFVPFAALGLISVFIAQGKKAALLFFIGGVATGMLLIGGILIARGGAAEIIASYHAAGILVGSASSARRLEYFVFYGLTAIRFSPVVITFGALSSMILPIAIFLRHDRSLFLATVFWLSFIGAALIEPAMKMGYVYHFTLAFPGLAGLCALALREIIRIWPAMRWINGRMNNILAVAGILLSSIWIYFSCSKSAIFYWPKTIETLIAAPAGTWPEKFTNRSEYLFMASEIKKAIPENGTLGISNGMHALYPLTGHLPSAYRLNDLSATARLLHSSVPDIRRELLGCAPDVLVVTTMNDDPLLEAILTTEIYETASKIPFDRQGRGPFDGVIIFRKTQKTICLEKQGMADWLDKISAQRK